MGPPGAIIALLIYALARKDRQMEALQEARVQDLKERASDAMRVAAAVESLNEGAKAREEANVSRGRAVDAIHLAVQAIARTSEVTTTELLNIRKHLTRLDRSK